MPPEFARVKIPAESDELLAANPEVIAGHITGGAYL
jgi:hypothetical protein